MSALPLFAHRTTPSRAVRRIAASATLSAPATVRLDFIMEGTLDAVCLPARMAASRADGLWRKTCFEAFLKPANSDAYFEFNFSPSTEWAAYRFDRYREGMANAGVRPPNIRFQKTGDEFALMATVDLEPLEDFAGAPVIRLALSAVVEDADGTCSYWALAHPAGKPDFHHPLGFTLDLKKGVAR